MSLIILGRDGVLNELSPNEIRTPDDWIPIPGSLEAVAKLSQNGYRVVLATNQAGITEGRFTIEDVNAIHKKLYTHLSQLNGVIEAIFYCPHAADQGCDCRKPQPGLFEKIRQRLRVPLTNVPCIGDRSNHILAGLQVGGSPMLVRTGEGQNTIDKGEIPEGIPVFDNLAEAVDVLLDN